MPSINQSRFKFGKNWSSFIQTLDEGKIQEAEASLKNSLSCLNLEGLRFLDIGSGSGLFSLAARRLGAEVHSFDYDRQSVDCTRSLRDKFYPNDPKWVVQEGSVLELDYLKTLGEFDIIYSWGVLHHTGDMEKALENVSQIVKDKGLLFISIYNDQGIYSKVWLSIKKLYNHYPFLRPIIITTCGLWLWKYRIAWGTVRYANPFKYIFNYGKKDRGMSAYHDLIDWVGGYPFEVAKPEYIFHFFKNRGFSLQFLKTCGGKIGCNEFVFQKKSG